MQGGEDEHDRQKDRGKKMKTEAEIDTEEKSWALFLPFFCQAMASCVLGCFVAMATVTW